MNTNKPNIKITINEYYKVFVFRNSWQSVDYRFYYEDHDLEIVNLYVYILECFYTLMENCPYTEEDISAGIKGSFVIDFWLAPSGTMPEIFRGFIGPTISKLFKIDFVVLFLDWEEMYQHHFIW